MSSYDEDTRKSFQYTAAPSMGQLLGQVGFPTVTEISDTGNPSWKTPSHIPSLKIFHLLYRLMIYTEVSTMIKYCLLFIVHFDVSPKSKWCFCSNGIKISNMCLWVKIWADLRSTLSLICVAAWIFTWPNTCPTNACSVTFGFNWKLLRFNMTCNVYD